MKKFCFGLKKSKHDPHEKVLCFGKQCKQVDFPTSFTLKDRVTQELKKKLSLTLVRKSGLC